MTITARVLVACSLAAAAACHPGPVLDPGAKMAVGGTIAGIVSSVGNTALPGRKVTAINVATGARFEATTGLNGGYTIKVPQGTYRLEVELQPAEKSFTDAELKAIADKVVAAAAKAGATLRG